MANAVIWPTARRGLVLATVLAGVLALSLAGCGRRGALDSPAAVDPAGGPGAVETQGGAASAPAAAGNDAPIALDILI
ncbi:lipoprotein [Stappia sp.]|uniref:lipoprotein n=1 Tax=Stappia sp. TaxID=1870903 RepID=UPI0032D954A6